MGKYIDAEKLIAEIERRIEETKSMKPSFDQFWARQISAFKGVKTIITSLQQEQPEVDLEKEMDKYYGVYRDSNGRTRDIEDNGIVFDWKDDELSIHDISLARHFYELGKARKEE